MHFPLYFLRKGYQLLCAGKQSAACLGQTVHAVIMSFNEPHAQLRLKRRYAAAHGRVADIQALGCTAYAAKLRDLREYPKLLKLHGA